MRKELTMINRFIVTAYKTLTCSETSRSVHEEGTVNGFRILSHNGNQIVEISPEVRQTFRTQSEAEDYMATLPASTSNTYGSEITFSNTFKYSVEPIGYEYCNLHGYSDIDPYEIIKITPSGKTMHVRAMSAERHPDWKPEFVSGGFTAHCTNNNSQRKAWIIKSDPEGQVMTVRLQKDGSWKSAMGRHALSTDAVKKYDYNF